MEDQEKSKFFSPLLLLNTMEDHSDQEKSKFFYLVINNCWEQWTNERKSNDFALSSSRRTYSSQRLMTNSSPTQSFRAGRSEEKF